MELDLDILRSRTPPIIGVDISSSAIKMVEIAEAGKGAYRLERYQIEPLPRGAVEDGNIVNLEAVTDGMRRAWKRLGSRVKNVALALPSAAVIAKKVSIPGGQREEEMELQVETEANQYIPFALDEVHLDYQVLGPAPGNPEEVEVLIAAARKEKVEDRVAAAQAAGLKALVMDVESYATQTAFEMIEAQLPNRGKDQTIAIVDTGASVMNVIVLRNEQAVYAREQPFGGNQLTADIQRVFNLSPEEAEAAKRSGGLPDNYYTDVLQPFTDTLALEVARALQFFFTATQYNQVDLIVLSGGCATIAGVDQAVQARTQVQTMVANPFAGMSCASRIRPQQLAQDAPALMTACGLAMRRFDT